MLSNADTPAIGESGNSDLDEVADIYAEVMKGSLSAENACQTDAVLRIKDKLNKKIESLKSSSRTAALWLQYMDMVDILRKFLRAECTGNWALHLEAISEMLPFMAVSGHNLYTKLARIYVQRMWITQTSIRDLKRDTMWSGEVIAYGLVSQ
jgi:hypothetical protein